MHSGGVLFRENAKAVMLDLVNPAWARRRPQSQARQTQFGTRQPAPEVACYTHRYVNWLIAVSIVWTLLMIQRSKPARAVLPVWSESAVTCAGAY
jgi:hypothetical protein